MRHKQKIYQPSALFWAQKNTCFTQNYLLMTLKELVMKVDFELETFNRKFDHHRPTKATLLLNHRLLAQVSNNKWAGIIG